MRDLCYDLEEPSYKYRYPDQESKEEADFRYKELASKHRVFNHDIDVEKMVKNLHFSINRISKRITRCCDHDYDQSKIFECLDYVNVLHAWLKDLYIEDIGKLNDKIESKKTVDFGHHFFKVKDKLVALSGDG